MKKLDYLLLLIIVSSTNIFAEGKKEGFDDLHKLTTENSGVDTLPKDRLSDRAFEAILEEMYPATANQLRKIKAKEQEQTNVEYENINPAPLTGIIPVATKPGAMPSTILVAPQHATTLNIIDSTGQPWPISAVMFGNPGQYAVGKVEAHKFLNIVKIVPKRQVGSTNINISLVGLSTTVTVKMVNSVEQYHPNPIIQIDREGPQAKPLPVFKVTNVKDDTVLKNIVLGIAPESFEKLVTSDINVEAWKNDGSIYIRTFYQPSNLPRGIQHGPSGYAAYRFSDMPVLVMTTNQGLEKKIELTEGEQ